MTPDAALALQVRHPVFFSFFVRGSECSEPSRFFGM